MHEIIKTSFAFLSISCGIAGTRTPSDRMKAFLLSYSGAASLLKLSRMNSAVSETDTMNKINTECNAKRQRNVHKSELIE